MHDECMPTFVSLSLDDARLYSIDSFGTDPGAVNVIDLTTRTNVAQTPIPLQPTGISILRLP